MYALFGVQFALRISLIFMLLVLLWGTYLFKYGLFGLLCSEFRGVLIATPLSFAFMAALRVLKLVATIGSTTLLALWDSRVYQALFVLNALASLALYAGLLHAIFTVGRPRMYKPVEWTR